MAIHETIPAERIKRVLAYIEKNRNASVRELADTFCVSEATARRDLDELAQEGFIERTHGGASALGGETTAEKIYKEKSALMQSAKRAIGACACGYVQAGNTVLLDSGTTAYQVALGLSGLPNLTIITNDLYLAANIEYDATSTVLVTGGVKRANQNVLIGEAAEQFFHQLGNVDIAFLMADAVDLTHGVTNAGIYEVAVKKAIVHSAKRTILCVDSSKLGRQLAFRVCDLSQIDIMITDDRIDRTYLQELQDQGVQVVLAETDEEVEP